MKLYGFQKKGLDRVGDKQNVALYWDMGLGKTFAGYEQMKRFGGRLNLIVCQKSKMMDWREHAGDNAGDFSTVYRVYPRESEKFIFGYLNKYIESDIRFDGFSVDCEYNRKMDKIKSIEELFSKLRSSMKSCMNMQNV